MSSNKLLFVCSDQCVFDIPTKYALKDKFKVYDSVENKELKEEERRNKLSSCNLVIIDVVNNKDDLKLINLNDYKKIAVLRNHESRTVGWCNNSILKADAICKFENRNILNSFKDVDDLLKQLQTFNISVDNDFKFYLKKGLRFLLFCINQSN